MRTRSEDVAQYLKDNPGFFEEYADLMAEIFIPHPHGGRAVSISERQIITLRDKARKLETKLRELIEFGEENDALSEKLHRLTLALLATPDVAGVLHVLAYNLREDFKVPHVALRLWGGAGTGPEFEAVDEAVRGFAEGLAHPYCSGHPVLDTVQWFGEAQSHLRSFAYAPVRDGRVFGLLALAAEDPKRFYPEMGTLYLERLAETAGAALSRHLLRDDGTTGA